MNILYDSKKKKQFKLLLSINEGIDKLSYEDLIKLKEEINNALNQHYVYISGGLDLSLEKRIINLLKNLGPLNPTKLIEILFPISESDIRESFQDMIEHNEIIVNDDYKLDLK